MELVGQKTTEHERGRLSNSPPETRVTEQSHLHRDAQLVGGSFAGVDPSKVFK
jgi:hypothetical protein